MDTELEKLLLQKEILELRQVIPEIQDHLSQARVCLQDYRADRRTEEAVKTELAIRTGNVRLMKIREKIKQNKKRIEELNG